MAKERLQPIIDEVEELKGVKESVTTLLTRLTTAIKSAATLQEVKEIAAQIDSENKALAQAVLDNTPAEENPETPPV